MLRFPVVGQFAVVVGQYSLFAPSSRYHVLFKKKFRNFKSISSRLISIVVNYIINSQEYNDKNNSQESRCFHRSIIITLGSLILSRLQKSIATADSSTQILLNSAYVQLHLRMCTAFYSIVDLQFYLRIYTAFNGGLSVASSDVHCILLHR